MLTSIKSNVCGGMFADVAADDESAIRVKERSRGGELTVASWLPSTHTTRASQSLTYVAAATERALCVCSMPGVRAT